MASYVQIILDKRRKRADDTYPVSFRIIHNRIPTTIKTGYSVQEKYWDDSRKKIKRGCNTVPDTVSCNYYLKKKEVELMKKIRELESKGILAGMTVKELKKELTDTPRKRKEKSFVKFTKIVIEELKKEKRFGTATSYNDALRFILKYSLKTDITFSEITPDFLKTLEKRYMQNPNNHYNGLAVYMRTIRAIFNRAIVNGNAKETLYPFRRTTLDKFKYHIRTEKTKKRAVSKEIIKKIEEFNFSDDRFLKYKYYFLFMFYTRGMNLVDLAHLKKSDIQHNVLTYKRAKTGKTYTIRLGVKAWNILKYFGYEAKKSNDLLFPIIKNPEEEERIPVQIKNAISHTNKALKKIADSLNLDMKLTTYVSRHTWATIADKSGIDRRIISQGLGHSNLHMTEIYINDIVSDKDLDAANDLIIGEEEER
jgi:integrase/recombinase XerD